MDSTRRQTLLSLLYGPGLIGLRAAVTGLPVGLLYAAQQGSLIRASQAATAASVTPQFLIFSTSASGDPVNCNTPGCYDDPKIMHAKDADMAATPMSLGSVRTTGARLWSTLPQPMLDRTSFFHHGTYTVVHPDQNKILHLHNTLSKGEILPSALSKALAPGLGTLRRQPIDLNGFVDGTITCDGLLQPSLTPRTLATSLSAPAGKQGDPNLLRLRDETLDGLNSWVKAQGKSYQALLIDQFATSRNQVRALQENVVTQLASIVGNEADSQLKAAVVLFQMKVTPVVMMKFSFGGDNHEDDGFAQELSEHRSALATLATLPALLASAGLSDKVTFCSLNVFGRHLEELDGRQHNDQHSVSIISGANVRGSVVGGVSYIGGGNPFRATPINSATGAADAGGDVTFGDTLASYGKTLAAACGVGQKGIDDVFLRGKIVAGALA